MKKPKLILSLAGLIILTAIVCVGTILSTKVKVPLTIVQGIKTEPGFYNVSYVSDGDTFSVSMDGKQEKVRLIGVDTPETVKPNSPQECYGKAASDFTKNSLLGKSVRLEADPINQNRDRYDRLIRYAYLQDGSLYNATLIREGYGFAYLSFPFTKSDEFRQLQVNARQNSRGVWSGDCKISNPDSNRPKSNEL